jgi:citrate lyase subunit beta/citryl-CoA lyase
MKQTTTPIDALARRLETARTFLFVPGARPDRFESARASGADLVVLDLQDAVGTADKEAARHNVKDWLERGHADAVRINGAGTPWHHDDLEMAVGHGAIIVLPEARLGPDLVAVAASGVPVLALVESAASVLDARALASVPGISRLALGNFDLASELGIDPAEKAALAMARSALVYASAAEALASPVDGVFGSIHDEAGLVQEVELAIRLGFGGKLLIHPKQVVPTATRFRPQAADIQWARQVMDAVTEHGVVVVNGQMVDKPVIDRARRLLANVPEPPG